jgi:outer membrane protein assembly factor BamB
MTRTASIRLLWLLACICLSLPSSAQNTERGWPTFSYDQERSGWNRTETTLSPKNVSRLRLQWSVQLSIPAVDTALSTLTVPLVAAGVSTPGGMKDLLILVGANDSVFALNADNGRTVWQKSFPNSGKPLRPASWLCSNTPNATPVVDGRRGLVFFNASDGKLRALDLATGEERMPATPFVVAFSRNWSFNLIDNVVYSTAGRGCGGDEQTNIEPGTIAAMDVSDLSHPALTRFYTGHGRSAGPWGHGGPVKTPKGVVVETADGPYDPASGSFGNTVVEVGPRAAQLTDSFTPANWHDMNAHDLDLGSGSATVFPFQNRTLVAAGAKEGVIYLLDASSLGGGVPDHSKALYQSSKMGNDDNLLAGAGIWGAMATYQNGDGDRYLYVPMWGPPSKTSPSFTHSYGDTPHGSIMAFRVIADQSGTVSLEPVWISRDILVPDSLTVANGVVYAVQTGEQPSQGPIPRPKNWVQLRDKFRAIPVDREILYAFDAETGKQLYSSNKQLTNWVHFNEPVVALGHVYIVSHDAHVYAFGLGTDRRSN